MVASSFNVLTQLKLRQQFGLIIDHVFVASAHTGEQRSPRTHCAKRYRSDYLTPAQMPRVRRMLQQAVDIIRRCSVPFCRGCAMRRTAFDPASTAASTV